MAGGFTVVMATIGARVVKRAAPRLHRLRIGEAFFIAGMAFCLLLAVVSERIGVAGIVGAFLAGMAFAEPSHDTGMHERTNALTEFLVPFFLVNIGLQLQLDTLRDPATLGLCALITALAIIGKIIGCGGVLWRQGKRVMGQVGVGMVPRGEVGIIVAQVGLSVGILTPKLFAVAVFMAVATTLIAPPFIKHFFKGELPELTVESLVAVEDVESGEV
jgi:Kef-type K+ transport system membrane component KefB